MESRFVLPILLLLLSALGAGGVAAETDEERYVADIRVVLALTNSHLDDAADALAACLGNFSGCVEDRSPVVDRLNASREGLVTTRASAKSLAVPERYREVDFLVLAGLTASIDGLGLHMQGLEQGSLETFEAGSDLTARGRDDLRQASDLLRATPPRSLLEQMLVGLLIAIVASIILSIVFLLRWYRRRLRAAPPRSGPGD